MTALKDSIAQTVDRLADHGANLHGRLPRSLRLDARPESQPLGRDLGPLRGDARLSREVLPPIAEHELVRLDVAVSLALLRQRVLHLEQVREVCVRAQLEHELERLPVVVHHGEALDQPVADPPPADHR